MIYTFYSYKGGVGRSMALANIAECFREKHLRVLMVDWDLEAPGLETYFYAATPGTTDGRLDQSRSQPGLIDMLSEYKQAFPRFSEQRAPVAVPAAQVLGYQGQHEELKRATEALTEQLDSLEIPEFLRKAAKQSLDDARPAKAAEPDHDLPTFLDRLYRAPVGTTYTNRDLGQSPLARYVQRVHETGGLYLLSAGARGADNFRSYAAKVQEFDWSEFYAAYEGRKFFEWLREKFAEIADVILIDSRTGVTEMGGVCTRQMPDAVVSFCAPNWQNVDGVVRIVTGLNEEAVRAARDDREVDAMVVPTRIDDAESTLLNEFRDRFVRTAEKDAVPAQFEKLENPLWNLQIPYIPRYNYREQRVIGPNAAAADPPTERLIAAYRKLAVHLAVLAGRKNVDLKIKDAFNAEIAVQFPHLGPSQAPRMGPRPPSEYVNRTGHELSLMSALTKRASLPSGGARIAVWGMAGTGKSVLAAFVVNQPDIQKMFPDGTVWLAQDRVWTSEAVASFFRSSFGLPSTYRVSAISEYLASRRFLVVIDDIREHPALDRITALGQNATYLLLTRDCALGAKFAGTVINVGDLSQGESLAFLGVEPRKLPLVPDSDPLHTLVIAFAHWPAGAAGLRAAFEFNKAKGDSAASAWKSMAEALRNLGAGALDALPASGVNDSIPRTIRDAVGQLEPAERRFLVSAAQGGTAESTKQEAEASAVARRLTDYGLLEKGQIVREIARLWLIYTGDLPDPGAHARSGLETSNVRDRAVQDRKRAQEILRGASAPLDEIKDTADRLKKVRSFSLARRLLERAAHLPEFDKASEKVRLKLIQQHALCTYRDAEMPPDERYPMAIRILETGDLSSEHPSQETLGLAGAAFKNLWRQGGQRKDLEHSFSYYERGTKGDLSGDYGYTRINAAFVLDLLAFQEVKDSPATSESRRAQATRLRQEISDKLPALAAAPEHAFLREQWWYFATLAEACFGLGNFEGARFWLRSGLALSVPEWEKESTTRQLADLAWAQGLGLAEGSEEWKTLRVLTGDAVPALRAVSSGKVGLALSGGGFRASLFHIGVLAKLAEADLLRHVEVLSCVSGGSIVGAHLYLELRHLLQTKADYEITSADYIAIVRKMQRDFLDGVQVNLRTLLFRAWFANLRTLIQPGYSRTHRLGAMFEEHLYSRVLDGHQGPRYLRDLRITPLGTSPSFNPKLDNWRRSARVPILLLNATTLNTGHNWQFAVTWMGEPPADQASVDSNDVLRRMYYDDEAPPQYRNVRLGLAVAASACVPALFDPVEMPNLYPTRTIRLVDGGVHDNQGTAGLLEQECRVMLVSDASGHMNSEREPGAGISSVPMRSNAILMARVREAQFRELESLRRSSALTGLMFLHLKKDLNVNHVDWVNCQDPSDTLDPSRAADRKLNLTGYGIPRIVQALLSGIRTDLDSFSDVEAYALMLSGYRMAEEDIKTAVPLLAADTGAREQWDFLAMERPLSGYPDLEGEHSKLLAILTAAKARAFKVWRLSAAAVGVGVLVLGAAGFLIWVAFRARWLTAAALWVPPVFTGIVLLLWLLHRVFGSRKSLTVLFTGAFTVTAGWLVAAFHLALFDPIFLRFGRVTVPGRSSTVRPDPVSAVMVAVALLLVALLGVAGLRKPREDPAAALAARAYVEREGGHLDDALRDYNAALAAKTTPELLRDRAYAYKLQRRYQESKADLESAQKLAPDNRAAADLAYLNLLLARPENPVVRPRPHAGRLYMQVPSADQVSNAAVFGTHIKLPALTVGGIRVQQAIPDRSQLRYVFEEDREVAVELVGRLRELGLPVEGPVHIKGAATDRLGHFELWLASTAAIPTADGGGWPAQGWCYQEKASEATNPLGLTTGYGAYCHESQQNCEKARSGSPTASGCVFVPNLSVQVWGGTKPVSGGYLGSLHRLNMPEPLHKPFPQPPLGK